MDRRAFVGGGVAALALGASGLEAQRRLQAGPVKRAPLQRYCRIRKDFRTLTATQLAAFRTGIATMKARPAGDPTSWTYQAAMHGTFASPKQPLWDTCEHFTPQFLSWHRLYLYYFERILRKASGLTTLALPYWNWQQQRDLPEAFRDDDEDNTLFTSNRSDAMNGGALMPLSAVAIDPAFAFTSFNSFTDTLESTPHGDVHVSVGGGMAFFEEAGLDPIFWLHHCNIDRLWERWIAQGGGRANPTGAAWRNTQHRFFNENGVQVTRTAADSLKTCDTLGYSYARFMLMPSPFAAAAVRLPLAFVIAANAPAAAAERVSIAGRITRAPISLAPVASRVASSKRVVLAFEGIRVRKPEGFYEIYLNPAKTEGLTAADPSYAGNLNFFGAPIEGRGGAHAAHQGMDRRLFDVTAKLADLRRRGRGGDALNVVLVLRLPEGGSRPAQVGGEARAVIERIRLVAE